MLRSYLPIIQRLFVDPIQVNSDPIIMANKKQLEHIFRIQMCPCGGGLCASKSEIQYGKKFGEAYIIQKCRICWEGEGIKLPLFSLDKNNYNNIAKFSYISATLSGIRTSALNDFLKLSQARHIPRINADMVKFKNKIIMKQ